MSSCADDVAPVSRSGTTRTWQSIPVIFMTRRPSNTTICPMPIPAFDENGLLPQYNLLAKSRVKRRWRFDILVAAENTKEYGEYVEFFHRVRYQRAGRKGLLGL